MKVCLGMLAGALFAKVSDRNPSATTGMSILRALYSRPLSNSRRTSASVVTTQSTSASTCAASCPPAACVDKRSPPEGERA
eukprot:1139170-Pyramimonas_sp.AAC.1